MPLVSLPVDWSFFKTIKTSRPALMLARVVPFIANPFLGESARRPLAASVAGKVPTANYE
jgi:hypothetical protein